MPYISAPFMPESIGVARSARGVTYRADDLGDWAAEVDEVLDGEQEISAEDYAAACAANDAHNAALPEPEPPAVPDAAAFKLAAYAYLAAAAFAMPLAGYIAPALDALNARNWALARQIIGFAVQAQALSGAQYAHLLDLMAEHAIPEA